ncbi:MAG: STM4012 family radical SAM protein [Pirellulales bacterium]|nr:STM4012 family radical SAM protein [Pirellulales bacterium]
MTGLAHPVAARPTLSDLVQGSPFVTYVYSYPHKTAHRPLPAPIPLDEVWAEERREALFLYFHVPFCRSRCGFCNLFSLAGPDGELIDGYIRQVRRQAERTIRVLKGARFARLAIGGGTPTLLSVDQLRWLLEIATNVLGARPHEIPVSVEASPVTVSGEKLALLREFGCDRLSLGVQSFDPRDSLALGRPQQEDEIRGAIELARRAGFPILNIDLIYGACGQNIARWRKTVEETLQYQPEEIYLYPLYVRPLTGLGGRGQSWDDLRLECYREARALLLDRGYRQVSFRMFLAPAATGEEGPVYCCQEDGMVGMGCGARSYTRRLHYSTPYAVPRSAVRGVLEEFVGRPAESFNQADHGIVMDAEDQRRRYTILSLLQVEGLSRVAYRQRFSTDVLDDLPALGELERIGLLEITGARLRLTAAGLERSDAIGPWLFSERVRRLMESYTWRTV